MPRFVFLTIGFEPPTPEIMQRWKAWFADIKDHIVQQVGCGNGHEIDAGGSRDLAMDADAITGVMIIEAADRDAAIALAANNPFITSIRIYETFGG